LIHSYALIFFACVAVIILIVYLVTICLFGLEVDKSFTDKLAAKFLDNDSSKKTIVVFDNMQMIYPELAGKQQLIDEFLIKCQHAQEMKKYDIILISRHANFTKAIMNKDDYLLTDVKYDDFNAGRLSFKSVC
jgi:hypothetical protein